LYCSPGEPIDVRNACVNPICDAHWEWKGKAYRVRGLEKGDYELVKERNGPFAGEKKKDFFAYCKNARTLVSSTIINLFFQARRLIARLPTTITVTTSSTLTSLSS